MIVIRFVLCCYDCRLLRLVFEILSLIAVAIYHSSVSANYSAWIVEHEVRKPTYKVNLVRCSVLVCFARST